jgi:beta-phosphoglucomutase-like phosphatase (HAD superfamily)
VTGSRKNVVDAILQTNLISDYFDVIVCAKDCNFPKPEPASYMLALKKLGLMPSESIVIEDSIKGVKAGKSAGIKVYALTTYISAENLREADRVFKDHMVS